MFVLPTVVEDRKVLEALIGDDPTSPVPDAAPVPMEVDVLKYPELVLYPYGPDSAEVEAVRTKRAVKVDSLADRVNMLRRN